MVETGRGKFKRNEGIDKAMRTRSRLLGEWDDKLDCISLKESACSSIGNRVGLSKMNQASTALEQTTAQAATTQSWLTGPKNGTSHLYAPEPSLRLQVDRWPSGLVYATVHQSVAHSAGKSVICAHDEFRRIQSLVSIKTAAKARIDVMAEKTNRATSDTATVERA